VNWFSGVERADKIHSCDRQGVTVMRQFMACGSVTLLIIQSLYWHYHMFNSSCTNGKTNNRYLLDYPMIVRGLMFCCCPGFLLLDT